MAIVDLLMPKMGESIMEATILKWNKKPGDHIQQDESLLEIATDKVDSEVPSTTAGIVKELLFAENDVVPVGAVIARIESEVHSAHIPENIPAPAPREEKSVTAEESVRSEPSRGPAVREFAPTNGYKNYQGTEASSGNRFYSPLVLNIASNEGISMTELERISGTGNEGRVTKKDILSYVSRRKEGNGFQSEPETETSQERPSYASDKSRPAEPVFQVSGNVEIQEMDRMRRLIADHMVRSKQTSPHVTSFSEADVTNLVVWREKEKEEFGNDVTAP